MLFFLLICFGFSAMCFYGLSSAQNPCTLCNRLLSVVGQYVVHIFVYLAVQCILKFTDHSTINNNRRVKFRKVGSCNWTRRRAYWLQKSVCRADYLAFARRSKTLAAKSFKIKATHTIPTLDQPTTSKSVPILDSVVASKETRVRRRLLKRRDLYVCRRALSIPFSVLLRNVSKSGWDFVEGLLTRSITGLFRCGVKSPRVRSRGVHRG